jgi:signal transduction histidine kinase
VLPSGISILHGFVLWMLASIVSTSFLGLVLMASADLRSRVHLSAVARRVVVLATMLLAGAARGLGIILVFALADVDDRTTAAARVLGSSVIFAVWLVLIGGFLSALAGYRAARQELLDEIVMRELQMRLVDEGRVADRRDLAALRMSDTTAMVREILASTDVGSSDECSRISMLLHRAIDERIRPLVHEMWFEPPPEFDAPSSIRGFLRRAFLTPVPLVWALALYAFIETTGALLAIGGSLGVAVALVEWVACAAVIVGERLIRPCPGLVSRSIMMLALLVAPLLSAWLLLGGRIEVQIPFFSLLAFVLTAPILTFTCCAARAVLDDRGPSLEELQERLERDDWAEQLEMLERRNAENSVASVIHNTVQARLLAAALQLETAAITHDQERATSALEDARTALNAAHPGQASVAWSPEERLMSIAAAWKGIVNVEIAYGSGLGSSAAMRLALDAVEECVANAARHASATIVEVSLARMGDGLQVIVSDNGSASVGGSGSGLGSDWMQRISAGRVTRTRTESGWNQVTLVVDLHSQ